MKYTIQHNGSDTVLIRIYAPVHQAASFLAFIDQKSRESTPVIKKPQLLINQEYFKDLQCKAFEFFDGFVSEGIPVNVAVSKTNYALKSIGFVNISYESCKALLRKSGRLRSEKSKTIGG